MGPERLKRPLGNLPSYGSDAPRGPSIVRQRALLSLLSLAQVISPIARCCRFRNRTGKLDAEVHMERVQAGAWGCLRAFDSSPQLSRCLLVLLTTALGLSSFVSASKAEDYYYGLLPSTTGYCR